MGASGVWIRNPRVLETEIGDDISLYDPHGEQITVLNTTASDIWRLLDGHTSIDEVTELLARAYVVTPESIRADIARAVHQLAEQELVTRKP